jgi:hypothetical protein
VESRGEVMWWSHVVVVTRVVVVDDDDDIYIYINKTKNTVN